MSSTTHVAAGHSSWLTHPAEANLINSRISDEAKEHSRQVLEKLGKIPPPRSATPPRKCPTMLQKIAKHVAGFSNPRVSDEAKEHSWQVLTNEFDHNVWIPEKDEDRVMGGHKAALNNPRVSEKAKDHSRHVLEEHDAI